MQTFDEINAVKLWRCFPHGDQFIGSYWSVQAASLALLGKKGDWKIVTATEIIPVSL